MLMFQNPKCFVVWGLFCFVVGLFGGAFGCVFCVWVGWLVGWLFFRGVGVVWGKKPTKVNGGVLYLIKFISLNHKVH